jgi:hypothetical protein
MIYQHTILVGLDLGPYQSHLLMGIDMLYVYQRYPTVMESFGSHLPKSMAHMPVPVAISKTLCKPPGRSFMGAL